MTWTSDVIKRFTTLMKQALSFGQIADMLSSEFGITLTRNAVIGWAARRGMTRLHRAVPSRRKKTAKQIARTKPPRPVKETRPPGAYLIEELRTNDCRWPSGDRYPFTFCGARQVDGYSYCEAHCQMSYVNWKARA